jgi:hypothetical protein
VVAMADHNQLQKMDHHQAQDVKEIINVVQAYMIQIIQDGVVQIIIIVEQILYMNYVVAVLKMIVLFQQLIKIIMVRVDVQQ